MNRPTRLQALLNRNTENRFQNVAFPWWPLNVSMTGKCKHFWVRLPGQLVFCYGLEPDYDERLVAEWGLFTLTRPETDEECQEREEGWAEEAAMEWELNRYTQWYY